MNTHELIQNITGDVLEKQDNEYLLLPNKSLKIKLFDGNLYDVEKIMVLNANMKQMEYMQKTFNFVSTINYLFFLKDTFNNGTIISKHFSFLPTKEIEFCN
jgi:hypothetical protein